jgi:hypothetical protein
VLNTGPTCDIECCSFRHWKSRQSFHWLRRRFWRI